MNIPLILGGVQVGAGLLNQLFANKDVDKFRRQVAKDQARANMTAILTRGRVNPAVTTTPKQSFLTNLTGAVSQGAGLANTLYGGYQAGKESASRLATDALQREAAQYGLDRLKGGDAASAWLAEDPGRRTNALPLLGTPPEGRALTPGQGGLVVKPKPGVLPELGSYSEGGRAGFLSRLGELAQGQRDAAYDRSRQEAADRLAERNFELNRTEAENLNRYRMGQLEESRRERAAEKAQREALATAKRNQEQRETLVKEINNAFDAVSSGKMPAAVALDRMAMALEVNGGAMDEALGKRIVENLTRMEAIPDLAADQKRNLGRQMTIRGLLADIKSRLEDPETRKAVDEDFGVWDARVNFAQGVFTGQMEALQPKTREIMQRIKMAANINARMESGAAVPEFEQEFYKGLIGDTRNDPGVIVQNINILSKNMEDQMRNTVAVGRMARTGDFDFNPPTSKRDEIMKLYDWREYLRQNARQNEASSRMFDFGGR